MIDRDLRRSPYFVQSLSDYSYRSQSNFETHPKQTKKLFFSYGLTTPQKPAGFRFSSFVGETYEIKVISERQSSWVVGQGRFWYRSAVIDIDHVVF